ncbi:MAG: diguanylate cyclase [Candidatus Calescibacterium sp.]|nr:diguanylate cyclase [Candidatus Calescibacterium sp.]MCX7971919.1 diguanylate cyclase [bacterium]MDW8194982.1 diguanylate cyclase [Candidatus Calescibacterium sp.]
MEKIFETILNSINVPILIINKKTREYEWTNHKAQEIIEKIKVDLTHFNDQQMIINNDMYKLRVISLDNNLESLILEPTINSFLDYETELLNFKGFFIKYETIYSFLCRKKKKLSISIIQIDRFENVIKNFSYEEAIKLSKKVAEIIKNRVRNNIDVISRYGTNLFVLLLVEIDKNKTSKILERIQKSILDYFKKEYQFIITISIASTEIEPSIQNSAVILEELQNVIQNLLYRMEYERKTRDNFILII